jgi:hypothetical protein
MACIDAGSAPARRPINVPLDDVFQFPEGEGETP